MFTAISSYIFSSPLFLQKNFYKDLCIFTVSNIPFESSPSHTVETEYVSVFNASILFPQQIQSIVLSPYPSLAFCIISSPLSRRQSAGDTRCLSKSGGAFPCHGCERQKRNQLFVLIIKHKASLLQPLCRPLYNLTCFYGLRDL